MERWCSNSSFYCYWRCRRRSYCFGTRGAPFISAAAGFAETAINGAIEGEDSAGEIIIDSVVSGFVNAAGTIGGVDCIKGGRLMNLAVKKVSKDVKKEARQTINKAFFSGVFSDLISNNILSWAT